MERINLSTNSRKIEQAYDKVVRGDPSISYLILTVDKNGTVDVTETGSGSLDDFVENFTDGLVQFGLSRATVAGSDVLKNLLIGWCPDNAPAKFRMAFSANFAEVSRVLSGYHVQVTARDQDDLIVDELLQRLGSASGVRYALALGGALEPARKPTPVVLPFVSKSIPSKPIPKASFVPKSTGNPVKMAPKQDHRFASPLKSAAPRTVADDGWDGAEAIQERDFSKDPLNDVSLTYKPTKVNINDLRLQKSDTISSRPVPSIDKAEKSEEITPGDLHDKIEAYKKNDDASARLTSLPKPKVGNVGARYSRPGSVPSKGPTFGAKPNLDSKPEKNEKLVGGLFKNFGSENGKTPAQIWAEKKGKFKSSVSEESPVSSNDNSELYDKFDKLKTEDTESFVPKPSGFPAPPKSSIPVSVEPEQEEQEEPEVEEEEKPKTGLASSFPAPPVRNVPSLPTRSNDMPVPEPIVPVLPTRSEPPAPLRSSAEDASQPLSKGNSAIAEYDYEKAEDNEIGFNEDDLIVEIDFVDDDWWSGKNSKTGEVGLFPASYVVLQGETEKGIVPESKTPDNPSTKSEKPSAVAEYDYEEDEGNEISFAEGDVIKEIDFVDQDWWSGIHSKSGKTGLFPANYVKLNE